MPSPPVWGRGLKRKGQRWWCMSGSQSISASKWQAM